MSDTDESEGTPPHVAGEFFLWLWYQSETGQGRVDLGETGGSVDYWVDDRIAFRAVGEDKVSAVMTGDNPSLTPEAHAALTEFVAGTADPDVPLTPELRADKRAALAGLLLASPQFSWS